MTDIINEFIDKFNPSCYNHVTWFRMIYLERDKYNLNNNPLNIKVEFMDIITKDLIIFGIADKYIRSIFANCVFISQEEQIKASYQEQNQQQSQNNSRKRLKYFHQ